MNSRFPLALAATFVLAACAPRSDDAVGHSAKAAATGRASGRPMAASIDMSTARRFGHLADRGDLVGYPSRPVVRHDGAYTWHRADVSEAHALRAIASGRLQLTTPAGEHLDFRYERHVQHPNGDWTWVGSIVGDAAQEAIITFGDKAAFGTIGQPGKEPLRLTIEHGVSWLIETDPRKIAGLNNVGTRPTEPDFLVAPDLAGRVARRKEASGAVTAAGSPSTSAAGATAATTVDLALGYTPGFVSYYGGESQALTRLNNMVDITNEAYVNSQIDARVRLVRTVPVNYTDSNSNDTALEEMTGFVAPSTKTTPAAAFSELRAARDQYGADLVSLVRRFNTPENEGCGIAWLIGGGRSGLDTGDAFFGYSVVSDGRDEGTDGKTYFCREETLAHELGHNMGSAHDVDTSNGDDNVLQQNEYGVFDYSFGYKTTSGTGNFYTIMAYGDSGQTRYRVFSNPRITTCGGLACGVDNQADNARSISQTISTVAAFRATVVQDVPMVTRYVQSDVDGDGKSDLLLQNSSSGSLAFWTMNGAAPVQYSGATSVPAGYVRVASGDFNGDRKLDIVWARRSDRTLLMWQGTGTGFSASGIRDYSAGWEPIAAGDIDGDGRSDLVFENASQGLLAYWLMNGPTPAGYSNVFTLPAGYVRAAEGDLNADGRLDFVLKRPSDRSLVLWEGTGSGFTSSFIRNYSAGWDVVAVGDIDGDARSDLLLRNGAQRLVAYWTMSGSAPVRFSDAYSQPAGYDRAATGDYNGDGKLDIVWMRASDRTLLMWQGTGAGFVVASIRDVAPNWRVMREDGRLVPEWKSGDVNDDGFSDLVLENPSQGLLAYWVMQGATPVRYSDALVQPAGYARAATGDFNGDGRLDFVWARASDRMLTMWLGTATGFTSLPIRDHAAGWAVTGAVDIDGDGRSDLVLQNASQGLLAYWTMSGASVVRYSDAYVQPSGHARVAFADVTGDGKADVLWARASDGAQTLWQGTGVGFVVQAMPSHSLAWTPIGAGDVDGDGRSDLVLQNASQGAVAYWILDGATVQRYSDVLLQPYGYSRVTLGEYTGDARLDVVWARASDRQLLMWQGNGTDFAATSIRDYAAGWQPIAMQ